MRAKVKMKKKRYLPCARMGICPIFPLEVLFTIVHNLPWESVADSRLYHGRVACTLVWVTHFFLWGWSINSISVVGITRHRNTSRDDLIYIDRVDNRGGSVHLRRVNTTILIFSTSVSIGWMVIEDSLTNFVLKQPLLFLKAFCRSQWNHHSDSKMLPWNTSHQSVHLKLSF